MRISKQMLEDAISIINKHTNNHVNMITTDGCGIYLEINNIWYSTSIIKKGVNKGTEKGFTNRQAYDFLESMHNLAIENCIISIKGGNSKEYLKK